MAYFTLVSRAPNDTKWAVEFGDYDREIVEAERDDMKYQSNSIERRKVIYKIIKTPSARQSLIDARLADENAMLSPVQICRHCDNPAMPGYGNCHACCEEVGGDY